MQSRPTTHLIALGVFAVALTACSDEHITTYRVPKEKPPTPPHAQAPHGDMPNMAATAAPSAAAAPAAATAAAPTPSAISGPATTPGSSGATLAWKAPASWQESKAGSAMRKATFTIPNPAGNADLAVTAFPGDVGGEPANVNRWRGQVGLAPLSDAEAVASVTRLDVNGLKIGIVDVAPTGGDNATRLLGAMVPFEGATWFFKLMGPDAVVAKEKPTFLEFIKTVHSTTTAASAKP